MNNKHQTAQQTPASFKTGDKVRVIISRPKKFGSSFEDPDAAKPFIDRGFVTGVTTYGLYVAQEGSQNSEWFSLHTRRISVTHRL